MFISDLHILSGLNQGCFNTSMILKTQYLTKIMAGVAVYVMGTCPPIHLGHIKVLPVYTITLRIKNFHFIN